MNQARLLGFLKSEELYALANISFWKDLAFFINAIKRGGLDRNLEYQELFYIYNSIEKMFSQGKKSKDGIITGCTDQGKEDGTTPYQRAKDSNVLTSIKMTDAATDNELSSDPVSVIHKMGKEIINLQPNNAYPPPKVSVIIPVFNRLDFTKKCLQSLFYRTNGNIPFEVIVVDNGSSDQTPNFLKEASKIWSSLKVILNSENLGFAKACNQGASIAQGS